MRISRIKKVDLKGNNYIAQTGLGRFYCCYGYYEIGDYVMTVNKGEPISKRIQKLCFISPDFIYNDKAKVSLCFDHKLIIPTEINDPVTKMKIPFYDQQYDYSSILQ